MAPRTVPALRGWRWIVEGLQLFLRKPLSWTLLILTLFVITKTATLLPILGLVVFLLTPAFLAGLMDACKATDEGRPVPITYLFTGFQRNAAPLVTLGGISMIGNLAVMALIAMLAGDSFNALAKVVATNQTITPELAKSLQAATMQLSTALLIGLTLSLPLLMALWFAPLLVQLQAAKPVDSLKSSCVACLKNMLSMFVYGIVIFAGLLIIMPVAMALRQYDLAFWLLAPVLIPSIYASYKDIYAITPAPPPDEPANPLLS